jgi:hypothetical protein
MLTCLPRWGVAGAFEFRWLVSEKRGLGSLFDHLASLVADCQDFSALRAALGLDGHQKADVFANVTKVVIKDEAAMDREYWKAAAKPIARTCLGAATANAIKQVMRAVHSFEHPVEPFGRPGAALTTRRLRPKNAARSEALAAASGWTRTQVLTKTTQQQLHVCVCVCVCVCVLWRWPVLSTVLTGGSPWCPTDRPFGTELTVRVCAPPPPQKQRALADAAERARRRAASARRQRREQHHARRSAAYGQAAARRAVLSGTAVMAGQQRSDRGSGGGDEEEDEDAAIAAINSTWVTSSTMTALAFQPSPPASPRTAAAGGGWRPPHAAGAHRGAAPRRSTDSRPTVNAPLTTPEPAEPTGSGGGGPCR